MESVFRRHLNLIALAVVLLAQVVGLAFQVKVQRREGDSALLIRVWTIAIITPLEKALVHSTGWVQDRFRDYIYLRGVRSENERLADEIMRLRLEQIRMAEDASQARRLQALFKFKEQYISETVAAQVIAGSGSELSRVIYIDKGANDGLKPDMAVINATGVVGKVIRVFPTTAQVLQINDQASGIGALLEKSRLQGILKGTPSGDTQLNYIMGDEKIEPGERILTSGGDHIFPKGLPIGTVVSVTPGSDMFLNIRVKSAARLNRLEEVLIVTKISEQDTQDEPVAPLRAADILAQRLPTVQPKAPEEQQSGQVAGTPGQPGVAGAAPATGSTTAKPSAPNATGITNTAVPTTTRTGTPKPSVSRPAGAPAGTVTGTQEPGATNSTTQQTTPKPPVPNSKPSTDVPR